MVTIPKLMNSDYSLMIYHPIKMAMGIRPHTTFQMHPYHPAGSFAVGFEGGEGANVVVIFHCCLQEVAPNLTQGTNGF